MWQVLNASSRAKLHIGGTGISDLEKEENKHQPHLSTSSEILYSSINPQLSVNLSTRSIEEDELL